MTQEEKARRYNEALERAKKLKENPKAIFFEEKNIHISDYIFPELKESEDERIRKALIRFHKSTIDVDGIKGDDIIALLEKQGEQNHADKVEPKFKMEKGKWYVCDTSRYTDFIVGKAYYCPKNGMLKPDENEIARYVARDCFHLWTIQDARDGDVLQLGGVTAIFKKYIGYENCECYCSVCNGEFEIPSQKGDDNIYGCYKVTPATKEQRDLLFRKMKEAGYEWDEKKKELKLLVTNGGDFESTPTDEEVQKLYDHLEMHKQLPKSEPQTIMFTDSGTMQVIEKLNEIIGKLGDIYEVLSKPYVFPYRDYTPPSSVPGMDVWYKTHGVEKVTPVTCETLNSIETNNGKDNDKERTN